MTPHPRHGRRSLPVGSFLEFFVTHAPVERRTVHLPPGTECHPRSGPFAEVETMQDSSGMGEGTSQPACTPKDDVPDCQPDHQHPLREILRECKQGDWRRFPQFVTTCTRRVKAAWRSGCWGWMTEHDIEDVIADAFVEFVPRLQSVNTEHSPVGLLFRIVACRCKDRLRSARRRGPHVPIQDHHALPDDGARRQAEASERDEMCQSVRDAVRRLPPRYSEVVVLWMEGESYTTIAGRLRISIENARQRHFRGIQRLRKLLQAGDDTNTPIQIKKEKRNAK